MTRAEYQAIRLRVYEARRACAIEADNDGRSSYGSKSIRENFVGIELRDALACDPRHRADKTLDRYGYFDSSRYEWRAHVRRAEVVRLLSRRRAGKSGTHDAHTLRAYLKPLEG